MQLFAIFAIIVLSYSWCLHLVTGTANSTDVCVTLKARCGYCDRSLHAGPNEDNVIGQVNRKCREKVGRTYVWKELGRCDVAYVRCKGINTKLTCVKIAELAKMRRRLP